MNTCYPALNTGTHTKKKLFIFSSTIQTDNTHWHSTESHYIYTHNKIITYFISFSLGKKMRSFIALFALTAIATGKFYKNSDTFLSGCVTFLFFSSRCRSKNWRHCRRSRHFCSKRCCCCSPRGQRSRRLPYRVHATAWVRCCFNQNLRQNRTSPQGKLISYPCSPHINSYWKIYC